MQNEIFGKQNSEAIAHLINLIDAKVVLEIGTCKGYNADNLIRDTKLDVLFGIDLKLTEQAKTFSETYKNKYFLFEGDSTKIYSWFKHVKFDLIYIDGGHSYEVVKQDLNNFYPLLRENGIFCGDDYNFATFDDGEVCGVIQAVNEFATEHGKQLFISAAKEPKPLAEYVANRQTVINQCRWYIIK